MKKLFYKFKKMDTRYFFLGNILRKISVISLLIFTSSISFGQIGNNYLDYTNGTHGAICATPDEGGTATLTAPSGTVFTTVNFVSYGTPTGSCTSFSTSSCNATTSQSVAESYLLGESGTVSIPANNTVFTDPCVGTPKRLYIQATYTQPVCSGTSPGTINGSSPSGDWFFYYAWEKSTTGSSSGFNTISGATLQSYNPGNLTQTTWFRRKVTGYFGGNSSYSQVLQITVSSSPSATISYSGSPYCATGTASVALTGTTGGTYSSTSGLSINSSTGVINLSASTPGTYTVTYTIAATGGCSLVKETTNITINSNVATPVFTLGVTSTRCQAAGTVTYTATAANSTAITYSLDAISIAGGNTINSSTGAVTYKSTWNGNSTITASATGCNGPKTATHIVTTGISPSVSASSTPTCVGAPSTSGSGTITITASGGSTPYTYTLNGGSNQAGNTFSGLTAGTYTVGVITSTGCTATTSVTVSEYANSLDDQNTAGTDSWIGHAYKGTIFNNYIGYFTESETFNEGFGGNTTCFPVTSNSGASSLYTELFSVAFKMNSTRRGLYIVDLGSDDGSRLTVDGNLIYNNWVDQSFTSRPRVLMNLTGSSSLSYEYYENGTNNQSVFQNLTVILSNTLSSNTAQSICLGSAGSAISGDVFDALPSGLSGAGYQWTYSTTPGGARTNITGATGATFTPNTSAAPFNVTGTYYIYRNAKVTSSNNTGFASYTPTNESNAATVIVNSVVAPTITASGSTSFCAGGSVTLTCSAGTSYLWSTGATTQSISPTTSGSYTVKVTNASGCQSASSSATAVTVNALPAKPTITASGSTTFCVGGSVTLTSSAGTSYLWSTGATTQSISTVTSGSYTVKVTNSSSCQSASSLAIAVTVNALPAKPTITASGSTTFCAGGSVTLTSSAGTSYLWSTGATTQSISAATSGNYTVKVINASGCQSASSSATAVTITAVPAATISYVNTPFCNSSSASESVTLTGTSGGVFSSPGLVINTSTGAIIPNQNAVGNYTVTYTIAAAGGCSSFTTSTPIYIGTAGTWSGKVDTSWDNPANWICGVIPNSTTDATIPLIASVFPTVISNTAEAKNLNIQPGASLVIVGTIKVAGDIYNNGNFNISNGTLEMNGPNAQTISGSMFENKTIGNLVVNNTGSGLSVSSVANDTLKITGLLSFGNASAILNTGDNITLVSTNAGTARVGVVGNANTINGKMIVERYINTGIGSGQHVKSWQFLAAPTMGQTIKQSWMENGIATNRYGTQITGPGGTSAGFDLASAAPSIKYYDYVSGNWVGVTNANNMIANPRGYMVFVRGDRTVTSATQAANATVLRTKGTLSTGTLPAISVVPDKMQSIGNPYASPIDFTLITKDAAIDNKFYVYDPYLYGSYGVGGYQTLAAVNNWQPVPGSTVAYPSNVANSIIQSGQAFFVHSTSANSTGTSTLTFMENCKSLNNGSTKFSRVAGDIANQKRQFLRTSLVTNSGLMADGNVVAFDKTFSDAVDGNDALKILNSGENFAVKTGGKLLAIEAKSPVSASDTIYYYTSNLTKNTYRLIFAPENMQSTGLQAFLVDKFLNTETPVSITDSSFINITVTSNAASSASDRFKIVFRQLASLPVKITSVTAALKNKDVEVKWNVQNESGIQQYQVERSSDGVHFNQVSVVNAKNNISGTYSWTDLNIAKGIYYYRIKIVSVDAKTSYTQVVKVVAEKLAEQITVYPNPVHDGIIHLQLNNQPEGVYSIRLFNNASQLIISKKITHAKGTSEETIACPNLSKGIYQLEVVKPDGNREVIKVFN